MWKQLLEVGKRLASLIQKTQHHDEAIHKLQQYETERDDRIERLAEAIQKLSFAIQHDRDVYERDRENLLLKLENALLRYERRLPRPGTAAPEDDESLS